MIDKKILIIDFDQESLKSLAALVEEAGFRPITAMDGLAGLEKFEGEEPDLVILEAMLPKIHGFELCSKINRESSGKIPVIIVTGVYREISSKIDALQVYGASAFFTKPWKKEELRAKILHLLSTRPEKKEEDEEILKEFLEPISSLENILRKEAPKTGVSIAETKKKTDGKLDSEWRAAMASLAISTPKKKAVKEETGKDIEEMLQETLAELGLDRESKKTKDGTEKKSPPIKAVELTTSAISPAPPILVPSQVKESPSEKALSPPPPEKDLAKEGPPPVEEVEVPSQPEKKYFAESEEKKKKSPYIFLGGILAGALIIGSTSFYLLKPKKSEIPIQKTTSVLASSPLFEVLTGQIENSSIESVENKEDTGKNQTVSSQKPKESTPPPPVPAEESPVENIQPFVPSTSPLVQIQDQPETTHETSVPQTEIPASNREVLSQEPPQKEEQRAAPKLKTGDLIPLNDAEVQPLVTKRVEPRYPSRAMSMRAEGSVVIHALISETGDVIKTEVLEKALGSYGFERAAEAAIRQWKFKPAQKDGINVRVWKPIEINFKLK